MQTNCPICNKTISLPEGAAGKKVKCGGCDAISRILLNDEGGYTLHSLDEAPVAVAAATSEAPAKRFKLQTKNDKWREAEANGEAPGGRRATQGGGRRRTTRRR